MIWDSIKRLRVVLGLVVSFYCTVMILHKVGVVQ